MTYSGIKSIARKVASVMNLLLHRRRVPLRMISQTCGISDRTSYRYINALSEAGIPLYYDQNRGGYRLVRDRKHLVPGTSPSETALAVLAFRLLRQTSGKHYEADIDGIIQKILVNQESEAFDLILKGHHEVSFGETRPMYLESTHIALITLAVELRKSIRVILLCDDDNCKSIRMRMPALQYRDGWCLLDLTPQCRKTIRLDEIAKVEIL